MPQQTGIVHSNSILKRLIIPSEIFLTTENSSRTRAGKIQNFWFCTGFQIQNFNLEQGITCHFTVQETKS